MARVTIGEIVLEKWGGVQPFLSFTGVTRLTFFFLRVHEWCYDELSTNICIHHQLP